MAPKFGTSGLRGLVTELKPDLIADYVRAFLASVETGRGLCVGRDLRDSSPRLLNDVIAAARAAGCPVTDCGALPTPALALAAHEAGCGAIMVTGSHIPADRNGLKFYSRDGEITKAEETAISARLETAFPRAGAPGPLTHDRGAARHFADRYLHAFGPQALAARRIGLYAHSAVGRDLLSALLSELGAEVIELGRSDAFVPVDTEAVDPDTRAHIRDWVRTHNLDALMSTDGDSDRPLLADETGQIVPGDIMGQITAQTLGAEHVVTPISSNSGVLQKGFKRVIRTRIGSPFVIDAMQKTTGKVVGYEANGGFLLGFAARGPAGSLSPLLTRDCILPLVVTLHAANGRPLSARVAQEPPVVTLSDRLQEVPQETSQALIARLSDDAQARQDFLAPLDKTATALDLTDGLRMTLEDGSVLHIRPSGNAPELRLYVEAREARAAQSLMQRALARLHDAITAE
jgi:phosphomannomutase